MNSPRRGDCPAIDGHSLNGCGSISADLAVFVVLLAAAAETNAVGVGDVLVTVI